MAEVEDLLPCRAPTVIHDTLSHYTHHGALARVDVSDDRDSNIILVAVIHGLIHHLVLELG